MSVPVRGAHAVAILAARRAGSAGQVFLHVDAPVAVLGPTLDLGVAEAGVDSLVLGHYLVGDQGYSGEPAAGSLLLGEAHQDAAEPAALGAGMHGDVLDEQVAVAGVQGERSEESR